MRKYLARLDWNNMLMNKTAIECWNILKYKIESIIDKFVPFKKQGKRSRKKRTSVPEDYEDYANYKEALNLDTTEIRKSKRTFEKKLAGNIKK